MHLSAILSWWNWKFMENYSLETNDCMLQVPQCPAFESVCLSVWPDDKILRKKIETFLLGIMACSCMLQHFRNFKELSGRLLKTSDQFFLAFLVFTVIRNIDPNPSELQNALSVIRSTKIIHIHIHIHTACLCHKQIQSKHRKQESNGYIIQIQIEHANSSTWIIDT